MLSLLSNSSRLYTSALIISFGLWLSYALLQPRKPSNQESGKILLPLCTQNILDKRFYHYSFNSPNVAMIPIQDPPCRLFNYQEAETVQCLNRLLTDMKMKQSAGLLDDGDMGELVLTFVGDSRIRQLYAERLKVLPFLDKAINNEPNQYYHNDFRSFVPIFDKPILIGGDI